MKIKKFIEMLNEDILEEDISTRVTEAEVNFDVGYLRFGIKEFFMKMAEESNIKVNDYKDKVDIPNRKVKAQLMGKPSDLEKFYFKLSSSDTKIRSSLEMLIY